MLLFSYSVEHRSLIITFRVPQLKSGPCGLVLCKVPNKFGLPPFGTGVITCPDELMITYPLGISCPSSGHWLSSACSLPTSCSTVCPVSIVGHTDYWIID